MTWKHRMTAFLISSSSSFEVLKYLEYLGGWNSDTLFFNDKEVGGIIVVDTTGRIGVVEEEGGGYRGERGGFIGEEDDEEDSMRRLISYSIFFSPKIL